MTDSITLAESSSTTVPTVVAQHNAEVPVVPVYDPLQLPSPLTFNTTGDGYGIETPPLSDLASAAWWREFGAAALAPSSDDALGALRQLADATGHTTLGAALDVIDASSTPSAVRDFVHSYVAKIWAEAAEGYRLVADTDSSCATMYDWGARATQYHEAAAQVVHEQSALTVLNQSIAGGGTVFDALAGIPQLAEQVGSFCLEMIVPGLPVNGGGRIDAVLGGIGADTVQTGAGCDAVMGFEGSDQISTGDNCDRLWGGAGDDRLDGGQGIDTAMYSGAKSDYVIAATADGFTVSGPEGVDTLVGVERIRFADSLFAVDTQSCDGPDEGGHLWQVAALFQAAFGTLPTNADLNHWTPVADQSANMGELAQQMMNQYAPGISAPELVAHLYQQIVHEQATAQTVQFYCDQVGPGQTFGTLSDLVAWAASQPVNTQPFAGLVGTVQQLDPSMF
jgi:hypothetical protein